MTAPTNLEKIVMQRLLARVGRAPCPGCVHYQTCKAERLACEAFRLYVMGYRYRGPDRAPSRAVFVKVFQAEDEV